MESPEEAKIPESEEGGRQSPDDKLKTELMSLGFDTIHQDEDNSDFYDYTAA